MATFPATERIARFVAEATLDAVPPAAVDVAKTAFMDCLSVALAGSQITPVVDRTYPLSEVPEAIRYLEDGKTQGKIVITV